MSTVEIAELTGKRHDNVMRKAKELSDKGIIKSPQIEETDSQNKRRMIFRLNKVESFNLVANLSPEFTAAIIDRWQELEAKQSAMPYHLQRYLANAHKVPHTHFSMLNEMQLALVAPLERAGYILPENLVPDISEGKVFCQWLRANRGVEPKTFPTYKHEYGDGRVVSARLYPLEFLPDFRRHFNEQWLPNHAPKYFSKRDQVALTHVTKFETPKLAA